MAPHSRILVRHPRARIEAILVALVGVALLVGGWWAVLTAQTQFMPLGLLLILLAPILIYAAAVEYFTFLEKVDGDHYLPDATRPPTAPPGYHTPPFGH